MDEYSVIRIFTEIADLLEIKGDNPYRIRAYRRAARALKRFPENIRRLWERGELQTIPGIGKELAGKISEILTGGTCQYLEELYQEVPPGLLEFLALPGVGPKTIRTFHSQLGIISLAELEKAARKGELRQLPGLGAKTELKILQGIQAYKARRGEFPLGEVLPLAEELYHYLRPLAEVEAISLTGGLRRRRDKVKDIDILVSSRKGKGVIASLRGFPPLAEVVAEGENRIVLATRFGVKVDLWLVTPEQYAPALLWATGSLGHYQGLRERAAHLGLELNEAGLYRNGQRLAITSEEGIYRLLELDYIPPELREDRGEIRAAAEGSLPDLVKLSDIKGDFHSHTHWSDGFYSPEKMAAAAQSLGYHYLAITDHSHSLGVAGGLSPEELLEQVQEIKEINNKLTDFRVLTGTEVDILADGTLDYPDDILSQLDVVIASVHSHFRQDEDTMTARIIKAITNPHVDILGHPTGRLLGRREPYAVDLEAVLKAAARTQTVLEINASPERLDLTDYWVKRAKEMGIKLSVNSDAHVGNRLQDMNYGLSVARRGWLEPDDLINTWPWEKVRDYFRKGVAHG